MREGCTKKIGKLLIALSLCVEARGLSLQPSQDPATQGRTRGFDKQTLLPNEKDARGSHKKIGKLLIALSLHAEAQGLFLHPGQRQATQARTRRLGKTR